MIGRLPVCAIAVVLVFTALPAGADNGGGVEATYSESNGCGIPRSHPPLASRFGGLGDSEPIRGPFGAMFGRTVGQARSALVPWTVPFTNGLSVSVHQRALLAFQLAAANLVASGGYYPTRPSETFGFFSRTVRGSRSISYHAVGAAVDVNSRTNPERVDGALITDMPSWYVAAWRNAGFCWGGDWIAQKDPMHYSWMGPLATPGYGPVPTPYPSLAPKASFSEAPVIVPIAMGGRRSGATDGLADVTGDGSLDAVRIKVHPVAGPIVEAMGSWADFGMCGFNRFQLPGADPTRRVMFGSTTYGGRVDVIFLDLSASTLTLQTYDANSFYQQSRIVPTGARSDPFATYLLADYDSDGRSDLFVVAGNQLEIWSGASGYMSMALAATVPVSSASRILSGDRDLDGRADLYAIAVNGSLEIFTAATNYASVSESAVLPIGLGIDDVLRVSDYDGDGHGDLYRLDANGSLIVMLGNRQIYADIDGWFRSPDFLCPPGQAVYDYSGRFADDEGSPFLADIEWAGSTGVTVGCNPPFNDWFCPKLSVTRAQMATFLVRTLGLPESGGDSFSDDDGSPHEADIDRVAAAGITLGCGPGAYCPHAPVTREQMASFLVRSYRLPASAGSPFVDVSGPHASDVAALFAAGITGGCSTSPPLYCPAAEVLREQMAAFLHRASDAG